MLTADPGASALIPFNRAYQVYVMYQSTACSYNYVSFRFYSGYIYISCFKYIILRSFKTWLLIEPILGKNHRQTHVAGGIGELRNIM